ncbi:MAG TPA: ubiquitin-like domain-containing protein [Actinomycetota bacterium]|nr:ubiquitin-like domain-containing protein [Actinomycetota bacterium]
MPVRPTRVRRLRARKAMGNAMLVGVLLAAGVTYVAIQKTVTLVVDRGRPEAVRTMSASVGEFLDAQGILVGSGDVVTPPQQTALADGMTVFVERRGFAGMVAPGLVGPEQDVGVWVTEGATASLATRDAENWFSAEGPGGSSHVVTARVVVQGKDHDVVTNAGTVRELLSAMGIAPDRDDRVLPSPKTPLHDEMRVRYDGIAFPVREVRVPIPHTTYTTYTDTLDPGEIRIVRQGEDGVMLERTRVKVVNGQVVGSQVLSRTVVTEAVATRRLMGAEQTASSRGSQVGEASWYSFAPGSGLTAAHPWLPFGTVVTVTNLENGETVRVVINDRGPFGGRIIDLSHEAFARIAPLSQGVAQVRLSW